MRLALSSLLLVAVVSPLQAQTVRTEAAGLRFTAPSSWRRVPAASDVRAAQWTLPRASEAQEDADLVLFFFGRGKGGSAQDNLDRWYGQFREPDGSPPRDAAVLTIRTVHGLRVTEIDLPGTYAPRGEEGQPKGGFRLLAAIVEGDEGPWFFKAVGPAATIAQAKPAFEALLASLEPHR